MPTVSELTVVLNVDDKGLTSGLSKAEKDVKGWGSSLTSGLGMGLGMGAVGAAIGAVGTVIGGLKSSVIDLNGSLEQSQIAFTTMLGSAEKSEAFLAELQKFAAQTPFEFPDLVSASKRMLAFGFESKNVVPLLTAVGDAVAAVGGGAEVIDGVTTALGQMQAKGKVSAEEMGQLAERGIPAWDMLAKKLGVSVAEAMDMVSKGQVKAGTFIEAFQEGAAQRFGGMMEKQSATWSGALSTISDSVTMATAKAFKPFFELISQGAIQLSKLVQTDTFNAWADSVAAAIGRLVTVFKSLISIFVGGDFMAAREQLLTLFPAPVADAIAKSVANLGLAFTQLFRGDLPAALSSFRTVLEGLGETIAATLEGWGAAFVAWVGDAAPKMLGELAAMSLDMQDWVLDSALTIIEKLGTWAAAFIDWIGPQIPDLLRELGAYLVKLTTWVITDALPTIVGKLLEWGAAFVSWIAPKIIPMLYELGKLEVELLTWIITTALPAIAGKLLEWAAAFVDWVAPLIPPLLLELGKLLVAINVWIITTALPLIVEKLLAWAAAFVDWIANDVLPKLPAALGALLSAITGWITEKVQTITTAAADLGRGIVQGIQDGVSGALGGFWSWLQTNFVDKIPDFIKDLLKIKSPSGVMYDIGVNLVEGLRQGMASRLPSIDALVERMVGRVADMGEVTDWLKAAIAITGVDDSWLRGLERLVSWESSGNPRARNPESVGGQHATGLLQTLPSTFRAYALPGMKDIFNPIHNAVAAIRYIEDTYGSVYRIPGVRSGDHSAFPGYGMGGWAGLHGPELAWLGERGPEYVVPNHALRGGAAGGVETHRLALTIGGQAAADIYVTGREVAIRYGRASA